MVGRLYGGRSDPVKPERAECNPKFWQSESLGELS
jgi:hypothetical protein